MTLPPLEEFERLQNEGKVITLNGQRAPTAVDALPDPQAAECVNA